MQNFHQTIQIKAKKTNKQTNKQKNPKKTGLVSASFFDFFLKKSLQSFNVFIL